MLKRPIKYEDFNGNEVEEVFYFNISKPELIDLDVKFEGGFAGFISKITETKDLRGLVEIFKEIIMLSYGEKSADGRHFTKSPELSKQFSQTAAYPVLYMELIDGGDSAVEFLKGILPKDMGSGIDQAAKELSLVPTEPPTS